MIVSILLFVLVHAVSRVHAATTPSQSHASDVLSLVDLTEISLSPNESTVQSGVWQWFCTPDPTWNLPRLERSDCQGALEYFYYETMTDGGRYRYEFLARGATRMYPIRVQQTPRKYTFGTCTLGIVMLRDFPTPETLPSKYKTGPPGEASTYHNLNKVAVDLVEKCVAWKESAGYRVTGLHDGIGVFVWATGSDLDKEIGDDMDLTFVSPTSGNGVFVATS